MSNKEYRYKNKEKIKKQKHEYYINNREVILQKSMEYYKNNKELCKQRIKKWTEKNRDKIKKYRETFKSKYIRKNKKISKPKKVINLEEKRKRHNIYMKKYNLKNPEKLKKSKHKEYLKHRESYIKRAAIWKKNNPQSTRSSGIEDQIFMNLIRKRDNNTCQWGGCGRTHREMTINVHHILSKAKYPELRYEERNCICYCIEHHALYHQKKGDHVSEWIVSTMKLNKQK